MELYLFRHSKRVKVTEDDMTSANISRVFQVSYVNND